MNIAILGAGAWGTALSILLCARHKVSLYVHNLAQFQQMVVVRRNQRYFPDFQIPNEVNIVSDLTPAIHNAELVLIAVPIVGLREILRQLNRAEYRRPIIWVCKGFEAETANLPHEVVQQEFSSVAPCGVLTGPSFANEVARGLPAAVTLASADSLFASEMALQLRASHFRIYSTMDVVGAEIAGALKNVIAIATGIADGLDLGLNARAALITRGLAEITRLGLKLGGKPETFMGLAGVGDLILTCTGDLSRNRRVGLMLAKGQKLNEVLAELGHVAEGVYTVREANKLAQRYNIDMPIAQAVGQILYEDLSPKEAVDGLLSRQVKAENYA